MFYPYYNNPYQPNQYSDLMTRLSNLEGKAYANQQSFTPTQNYSNAPITPQPTQTINTQNIIYVTSEQQAWDYTPDMSGAKQVFYNENNNEFYVKQFDGNIPKTFKTIYKPSESVKDEPVPEATETQNDSTGEIVVAINDMSEKIEGKIDSLTKFIQSHPFIFTEQPKENKSKGGKK